MNACGKCCRKVAFLAGAALLMSLAGVSSAQAPAPSVKDVVAHLQSLTEIPIQQFQFLPHDDARGAAPDRDDSSWQRMATPAVWNDEATWLRVKVQIPGRLHGYDIRGARVQLALTLWGDDTFRVFVNGVPVVTGDESEPVLLQEHATTGETLVIAIYVAGYNGPMHLKDAKLMLDRFPGRPDPWFLGQEFLVADEMIQGLAPGDAAKEKILDSSLQAVNFSELAAANQPAFDDSLRAAQQDLEALRPWMQSYTIHAVGNSHIDMAWLWPWTETVDVVHRTWGSALQLMREFPDLTYTHSTAAAYLWMQEKYPGMFQEIQQRVKEGRWEVIGGMWVEPDLNMPDGESQVRQLLLGKKYFQREFNVDVHTGWNPDSFGYNWQLPQIYKRSGVNFFVTQKLGWNDTTQFPYKLFWWESPDGSRVLTYFPHDYANPIDPVAMAKDLTVYATKTKYPDMLFLFGIGDHGGGPTRSMLETAETWKTDAVYPKLELGTAQSYFDQLAQKAPSISIPTWDSELYLQYHRGVFTTQAETKKRARQSEALMLSAEKFASFASLFGEHYPADDLRLAWEKVLFNQFHDIAAGSGITDVYRDAAKDYAQVHRIGEEHLRDSLQAIASHVNTTSAGVPVLVFNPLSWQRTGAVEADVQFPESVRAVEVRDAQGREVLSELLTPPGGARARIRFLADGVPALGYETFSVMPVHEARRPASTLKAGPNFLENEYFRVVVDPKTGCITSLVEKTDSWEALPKGACGNELQTFVDKPKAWDAWNIDADFEDHMWHLDAADEVKLVENTPLRAVLRVRKHFQDSTFVQDITMYPHVPRVDVRMRVDWHEKHILLKVAFPVAVQSNFATYEIPYGSIRRPTTRNTPEEKAQFEVPALRWADLSDSGHGLSLLNNCKYGYDGKGNVLRLSLLRSPVWPDPHADQGEHDFTYSIFLHSGRWQAHGTMQRGYELNYPLDAMQAIRHTGALPPEHSFVTIEPANLILTAVKQAEGSDGLILRFYEFAGKQATARITIPPEIKQAFDANLMEQSGEPLAIHDGVITMPVGPYQIRTIRLQP